MTETTVFEAGDYHAVESMELVWDHSAAVPELRMHLVLHNTEHEDQRLSLDFFGVADLKLQAALSYNDRIGTLRIRDIREREWSDMSFEVYEPGDNGLYFMCSSWTSK